MSLKSTFLCKRGGVSKRNFEVDLDTHTFCVTFDEHLKNTSRTMIKRNESCLYCNKQIEAKNIRKTFCDDKCRIYHKRELKYKKIFKILESPEVEVVKTELAKDLALKGHASVRIPLKKWSLAEQLAQVESDKKTKTK